MPGTHTIGHWHDGTRRSIRPLGTASPVCHTPFGRAVNYQHRCVARLTPPRLACDTALAADGTARRKHCDDACRDRAKKRRQRRQETAANRRVTSTGDYVRLTGQTVFHVQEASLATTLLTATRHRLDEERDHTRELRGQLEATRNADIETVRSQTELPRPARRQPVGCPRLGCPPSGSAIFRRPHNRVRRRR